MYVYVDEVGNLEPPSPRTTALENRVFILGAIVIRTNKCRRRIGVAVTRAVRELQRESLRYTPWNWVPELKGTELRHHGRIRMRLFRRVKNRDVRFYALVVEKRGLRSRLAYTYGRRYSRIALNLIARIPIPRHLKQVVLVIDRGGGGRPLQHRQSLVSHFRGSIKTRWTNLLVYIRDSQSDRGLQIADVWVHFVFEGLLLRERVKDLKMCIAGSTSVLERTKSAKLLSKFERRLEAWTKTRSVLRGSLFVLTVPPIRLYRTRVRNLVAKRIAARKRRRGNRGR
jgi:hypothetical protein